MSLADLFRRLGAPLNNVHWSWGAVSENGDVFLRVWQDQYKKIGDKGAYQVTHHRVYMNDPENLGYKERCGHVDMISAGANSFCVLCIARDPYARPREIASFDDKTLFVGGELIEYEGDSWLVITDRVSIQEFIALHRGAAEPH